MKVIEMWARFWMTINDIDVTPKAYIWTKKNLLEIIEVWRQAFVTSHLNILQKHHVLKDNLNDEIGNANKVFQKYINPKQFLAFTIVIKHAHKTQ
jgi:hypothetical protein